MNAKHLLLAAAALATASATADITVQSVSEKDGSPWSATFVAGGKVRTENFKGDAAFVLWQVGATAMTTVVPARKTYMVMDAAQIQAQLKQAADQMKQVEQQLAGLPPQMREMMKKQMPGMGAGKPLIEMKLTKTGKTMSKAGFTCQVVDLAITGLPMAGPMGQEFCVVDPAKLDIPASDLATLKAMAEFAKQMTKDIGQVVGGMPDVFEMGGWPVWTRDKRTGDAWVFKAVDKGAVSADKFQVPAGYKQEKMPGMPGGR